jgi:hypothetical protein
MPSHGLEIYGDLDDRSKEFYEFVIAAADIIEEGNDLVVTIDLCQEGH